MEEEIEIWKDIIGWEGCYQISNLGSVKSLKRKNVLKDKILKHRINKYGYACVTFRSPTKNAYYTIHRLVAITFILNLESKLEVNHIDGNKLNNHINNLEWCTNRENIEHAVKIGLSNFVGENNPRATISESEVIRIKEFINFGLKTCSIRRLTGISESKIQMIRDGKAWRHVS